MSYLPYLATAEKTKLSPRARELAMQIEKVIQEFQRSYPDTPAGDVEKALTALSGSTDRAPASRRVLAITLALGIAALGGVLLFIGESGDGMSTLPANSMLWVVAGVIVMIAVAAMARRR